MKVYLELDSVEAHLTVGSITDQQLTEQVKAAHGDEAASIRAQVLGRVATRIVDQLMPPDPRRVILAEEIELGML